MKDIPINNGWVCNKYGFYEEKPEITFASVEVYHKKQISKRELEIIECIPGHIMSKFYEKLKRNIHEFGAIHISSESNTNHWEYKHLSAEIGHTFIDGSLYLVKDNLKDEQECLPTSEEDSNKITYCLTIYKDKNEIAKAIITVINNSEYDIQKELKSAILEHFEYDKIKGGITIGITKKFTIYL